jgi:hypothetical protein
VIVRSYPLSHVQTSLNIPSELVVSCLSEARGSRLLAVDVGFFGVGLFSLDF